MKRDVPIVADTHSDGTAIGTFVKKYFTPFYSPVLVLSQVVLSSTFNPTVFLVLDLGLALSQGRVKVSCWARF